MWAFVRGKHAEQGTRTRKLCETTVLAFKFMVGTFCLQSLCSSTFSQVVVIMPLQSQHIPSKPHATSHMALMLFRPSV